MILSRCCKDGVTVQDTECGLFYHCYVCDRPCETFSVLSLSDMEYGMKDQDDTKHQERDNG